MGARRPLLRRMAGATSLFFTLSSLVMAPARAALATTCYLDLGSKLFIGTSDFACGVVNDTSVPLTCCSVGDICLGHNICHVPTGPRGPGYSGYYLGGCNDPNFKDSSCTTHCTSNLLPDVVYNTTTKQWNCCNTTNSVVDCNHPIAEAFDAPAPADLSSTFSIPASTASSTSSSSSYTSTSTSSTTPTSSSTATAAASTTSLSTGAQAGIGVGVGIAGLSILAFLAFLLRRHLRCRTPPPAYTEDSPSGGRQSQAYQNPAWQAASHSQSLQAPYAAAGTAGLAAGGIDEWVAAQTAAVGGFGVATGVIPKSELPTPEQNDPRYVLGRAGTGIHPFELAGNEVRRELGIMP